MSTIFNRNDEICLWTDCVEFGTHYIKDRQFCEKHWYKINHLPLPGEPDNRVAGRSCVTCGQNDCGLFTPEQRGNWECSICIADRIPPHDSVNHPAHYTSHPSGVECLTITRHMNFSLGNALKYIWRAGLKSKNPVEDLRKAVFYINDEIKRLENK